MRLLFRDDLTCTREERQGVAVYHVEDPNTGAVYRLYEIEYLITGKLDGTRDDDEVIAEVKRDYGFTMTDQDFEQFVNQLTERGFVRRVDPEIAFEVGESESDDQDSFQKANSGHKGAKVPQRHGCHLRGIERAEE